MAGAVTLVLGGTRSGKSEVAERLALARPGPVLYLATGTTGTTGDDGGHDADMAARIERHRARRDPRFRTLEVGRHLVPALHRHAGEPALVDSLGTWVAGHPGLDPDADALVAALRTRTGATVVVSDEVGMGVHPSTEVGRRFRDALGEVNRAVADLADEAWLVVAGRGLRLDRLPPPGGSDRPPRGELL